MRQKPRFQLRLIGARLLGPPPINDVWVPLEQGVHAFYGKNGAGKSRLLYALADVYCGKPSDSYLVAAVTSADGLSYGEPSFSEVEVDVPLEGLHSEPEPPSRPWAADARSPWERELGKLLWPVCAFVCGRTQRVASNNIDTELYQDLDEFDDLDEEERAELLQRINQAEHTSYQPLSYHRIADTLAEIVNSGLLALTPTEAGWLVAPAISLDGIRPFLSGEIDRLIRVSNVVQKGRSLEDTLESYGVNHLNSLAVVLSPLLDAVREADTESFQREVGLLREVAAVPYRLGSSPVFSGLSFDQVAGTTPQVIRDDSLSIEAATAATRDRLYRQASATGRSLFDGPETLSPGLLKDAQEITEVTRHIYEDFLVDAPALALQIARPQDWFVLGDTLRWVTRVASGPLPLRDLSEAQLRWALTSIAIAESKLPHATAEMPHRGNFDYSEQFSLPLLDTPLIIALDEPDGALHATAQRHAVNGLVRLSKRQNATIWVSTHSREFLNHSDVTPHHISRDATGSLVRNKLGPPQRARVDELGLAPADLLLLHRAVLIVEGAHDQAVLDALIGSELAELRVLVLPMRGGRLLATVVDSYLLAHFSDTPVIAALDNLVAERVNKYWMELVENRGGGQAAFDRLTRQHFNSRERDEETFLINYCRAAAELGQLQRFQVFPFSKRDIPEYLPVNAIVPKAQGWEALWYEFTRQTKIKSFKPWLKHRYGVDVTEDLLRFAAEQLDEVPADFIALLDICARAQHARAAGE
jgi:hypothetical protein